MIYAIHLGSVHCIICFKRSEGFILASHRCCANLKFWESNQVSCQLPVLLIYLFIFLLVACYERLLQSVDKAAL